jgi:hypothetical protein
MICSRQPNNRKQQQKQQKKTTDRRTDEIGEQEEVEESCPGRPAPLPMIVGAAAHCSYCTKSRPRRRTDSHNWMYPAPLSLSLSFSLLLPTFHPVTLFHFLFPFVSSPRARGEKLWRKRNSFHTPPNGPTLQLFIHPSIPPLFPAVTINHGHPSFRFSPKKKKKNEQYV